MFEVRFEIKHKNCWAQRLSQRYPKVVMTVFSSQRERGLSKWVSKNDEILEKAIKNARGEETLLKIDVLEREKGVAVVQSICKCEEKNRVHEILERNGCYYLLPSPILTKKGSKHYRILVPEKKKLQNLVYELKKIGDLKIESVKPIKNLGTLINIDDINKKITERQKMALKLAHKKKYYEIPKNTTIKEMAKEFGVSESNFYELLTKAENKIIKMIIDHIL